MNRIPLFVDSWSIVQNIYSLNQLLNILFKKMKLEFPNEYLNNKKEISILRNKMTHIGDNIANMAKSKNLIPPIFGSLSFCYVVEFESGVTKKIMVITTASGSLIKGRHSIPILNPIGKEIDGLVGLFEFSAFGVKVNLSKTVDDVRRIKQIFNGEVSEKIKEFVRREIERLGGDVEKHMSATVSSPWFVSEMEFSANDTIAD